jgi:hypothetical protein
MRAMTNRAVTNRAVQTAVLRAALAVAAGAVATAAMTLVPLLLVERGKGCTVGNVFRGVNGWFVARDEVFGVHWVNLQLMPERLINPVEIGELPAWAEPPSGPYPTDDLHRAATLAAGWPLPSYRFRWIVIGQTQAFPMVAEADDQDTSISYATEDVFRGNRGGGPSEASVIWPGALANLACYAGVSYLFLVWRGRAVIRRIDTAGAR